MITLFWLVVILFGLAYLFSIVAPIMIAVLEHRQARLDEEIRAFDAKQAYDRAITDELFKEIDRRNRRQN